MEFTFRNYKIFCKDFKIKPSHYDSLKIFSEYCKGDYDIIFRIGDKENEKN